MGRRSRPYPVGIHRHRNVQCPLTSAYLYRPEIATEFTVSVWMGVDEGERRLLGSMELNGPDLYDIVGEPYGKSPSCILELI
jgi:hypothetical protein